MDDHGRWDATKDEPEARQGGCRAAPVSSAGLVEQVAVAMDAVAVHDEQVRDAMSGLGAVWAGSPRACSHSDKAA